MSVSTDGGVTFTELTTLPGEPYKFAETEDPDHLFVALSDGTILETTDGWRTFATAFAP